MKLAIVVGAMLSIVQATNRQLSQDVIGKFRQVAGKYSNSTALGGSELADVRKNATGLIGNFHHDIILIKEDFMLDAILQESGMHFQIANQPFTVDRTCLNFLNTSLEMDINLAGVGFTNCISRVDELFNGFKNQFYNRIGAQDALMGELRILDVFRGENVFYTPQNIIAKLDLKWEALDSVPESVSSSSHQALINLKVSLEGLRTAYIECMTSSEQLLRRSIDLLKMQFSDMCLGESIIVPE
ncbi:uncharacterized protein LOC129776017 [Toxorhynchites rutilus septentrionalis]|uniref:uncharacterized protein LOC129776017 n=1 Tax=Toxorhynchites rutilus septentrionalis TaxID=329112 RepID=UPI00247A44B6|nr:uncharacterized protein LOC129776017 [Toxorhynchites rutilus septentrionalis]